MCVCCLCPSRCPTTEWLKAKHFSLSLGEGLQSFLIKIPFELGSWVSLNAELPAAFLLSFYFVLFWIPSKDRYSNHLLSLWNLKIFPKKPQNQPWKYSETCLLAWIYMHASCRYKGIYKASKANQEVQEHCSKPSAKLQPIWSLLRT